MKILKTKWYLYKITGPGSGVIRAKPLNTKKDGKRILEINNLVYQGWTVGKGSRLKAYTAGNQTNWEVI